MKLKGISKLVLAGTALAATAATLTTATYAWYVTNAKVDATGVSGQVASSSTGSLFIAKNSVVSTKDTPQDYLTKITLEQAAYDSSNKVWTAADVDAGKYTFDDLQPQTKTKANTDTYHYFKSSDSSKQSGKTYYKVDTDNAGAFIAFADPAADDFKNGSVYERSETWVWVDQEGYQTAPKLVTFKFWLKADKGGDATVKLTLDNTSASVASQIALSTSGLPTAASHLGDSITADAVHALRMDVTQQNGLTDATGTTTAATVDYQLNEVALGKNGSKYSTAASTAATRTTGGDPVDFTDLTGGDANEYYTAVLGKKGYNTDSGDGHSTDSDTGQAAWTKVTLTAGVDTLLTFNIWLEGSDTQCWDSCRGQQFTLAFNFELAES